MHSDKKIDIITLREKISKLLSLKKEGDLQLMKDRKQMSEQLSIMASNYEKLVDKKIDQKDLNIG